MCSLLDLDLFLTSGVDSDMIPSVAGWSWRINEKEVKITWLQQLAQVKAEGNVGVSVSWPTLDSVVSADDTGNDYSCFVTLMEVRLCKQKHRQKRNQMNHCNLSRFLSRPSLKSSQCSSTTVTWARHICVIKTFQIDIIALLHLNLMFCFLLLVEQDFFQI